MVHYALDLGRNSSDGDIALFRKNGATVGSIGAQSGRLTVGSNSAAGVRFDGTQLVPMNGASISDNTITLGDSGFRFKDLYLSGGAYLGGTAAANKLDGYEEGIWTPVLSGTGCSFGTHAGSYVKVGKMVYVTALLNITAVGSDTSSIGISGYPFNAHSATNQFQTGTARQTSTTGTFYLAQINVGLAVGGLNSMDGISSGSNKVFTTGNYSLSLTYISA